MDFEEMDGGGPLPNIGVLRHARANISQRGGELIYTVYDDLYTCIEMSPELWSNSTGQQKLALTSAARDEQITQLNAMRIERSNEG